MKNWSSSMKFQAIDFLGTSWQTQNGDSSFEKEKKEKFWKRVIEMFAEKYPFKDFFRPSQTNLKQRTFDCNTAIAIIYLWKEVHPHCASLIRGLTPLTK